MYQAIRLDYDSLDNYLSKQNLDIHYQMYRKNLKQLNTLLKSVNYNYAYSLEDLMKHIDIFPLSVRGEILYYLSSIVNHNLYFKNMSNRNQNKPVGKIEKDIDKYFGNYDNFRREFKKKAMNLKGSGYTFLVKDKDGGLKIINTSNEDNPTYYGMDPVMNLDLWEHAYFLDYYDDKGEYVDNFFKAVDFGKINETYTKKIM